MAESSGDSLFLCYYKGRFVTKNGVPVYVGGEVHRIECEAHSLFKNLAVDLDVSLYRQRIWYKLPFEEMTELKLLLDGSEALEKMCYAALWTKQVAIFMEEDDIEEEENAEARNCDADRENRSDDDLIDIDVGGVESNHDEARSIEVEVGEEDVNFAEDARVEERVARFVDNEDEYDYHDTPENSDAEEVESRGGRRKYEIYIEGSGELKLRQGFESIKKFKAAVIDYVLNFVNLGSTNPGSTVEVGTISVEGGLDIFDRFYVCFGTLKRIWKAHCRPIIGIDGCFMKCDVKGQLLAAVGRDANNQFYPVAWAIVQAEDKDSWLWFIEKLQTDLGLGNGEGFTLISDRQKGLLYAVGQILPNVEHRMCARHIYGNLRSKFPGRKDLKKLFWRVAESFNDADYEKAKKEVESYDVEVFKAMMEKDPEHCTRAYFKTTSKCEDVHNNFSESYNNSIDKARAMPVVEMLETIRRQAMRRIDIRRVKTENHMGTYSLKVADTIALEEKKLKFCDLIAGSHGQFEVRENGVGYSVSLSDGTCKCRRWDITGIPCRHALKAIFARKLDPEKFVSHWYLTSKWRAIYGDSIGAVNGMHFWRDTGDVKIQPPEREVTHGAKKKQKRIKGKNESPKKKKGKGIKDKEPQVETKVPRPRVRVTCANCGNVGHNAKGCRNPGVRWKTSYRTKKQRTSTPFDDGESSQNC